MPRRRASSATDEPSGVTPLPESVAGLFLMGVVWPALVGAPLRFGLRPPLALAVLAGVGASFLAWSTRVATPAARRRRLAVLRLRVPGAGAAAVAAAVVAGMAAAVALTIVYARLVHEPTGPTPQWAEYVERSAAHRLVGSVAIVGLGPVIEEFAFRGVLLTRLERRFGAARAVLISAGLFAALHGEPWLMPVRFALGALCGVLAWSSDSIWTAVMLHAAWNAFAYLDPLTHLWPGWSEGPRALPVAGVALACATAAVGAAVARLGARARDARRGERSADVD